MKEELYDPWFERIGPALLRIAALASTAIIATPIALVGLIFALPLIG